MSYYASLEELWKRIELQSYSRWTYDPDVKNLLIKHAKQLHTISFLSGMGGDIVYRILAHNPNYYWEDMFCEIKGSQVYKRPLDWPDHDLGYNPELENFSDENGQWNVVENVESQQLTRVHVGGLQLPNRESADYSKLGKNKIIETFLRYFKKLKGKKLLVKTHDLHVQRKYPDMTVIRLCGKPFRKKVDDQFTHPVQHLSNVINVNINKLLSHDYITFEKEYFSLCNNLNINATPIPVRGYILNYLDRLNNNSNNVIPRMK
tara:strand:+ start:889 stop:1674 length:786 start_codon:yes stop_codon:yes gene_type:complete